HIALPVNVCAKGVGTLPRFFVKIAAGEHVIYRQPYAGVVIPAELENVHLRVNRVEVCRGDNWGFLEERIVIMPGPQFVNGYAAIGRELAVDFTFSVIKRLAGKTVELVEKLEHLGLVLLVEIKLHDVVILEPELPGGLVAQTY